MPKSKYSKKTVKGVEYFRTTFTLDGKKYDLLAKTEKELEAKIDNIKFDSRTGNTINSPNMTVATWANEWLEVYKKPVIIEKSYNLYKTHIKTYINPEIGNMRISEIQPVHLQKILSSQAGMSFSHVSHVKNAITGMFKAAHHNGYINKDPSINLLMPASTKGTHRCITEEEEQILFKVCETHYFGLYPLLMYHCGIRPGECAALLRSDIDLESKLLYVSKALESQTRKVKTPKTKSGIREIPIPDDFIDILSDKIKDKALDGYILTTGEGNVCTGKYLHDCWQNIKRHMNIESGAEMKRNKIIEPKVADDFTPYCLRHTYCTNLQRAGVPLNVAKYLMGHNDIKMVANIYGHQTDDQTEAARTSLNTYFSHKKAPKNGTGNGNKNTQV